MILLFDDNKYNQMSKSYGADMIEKLLQFQQVITHFDKPLANAEFENLFSTAKGIFIHGGFEPEDFKDEICFLAEKKSVPLVIFSGAETTTALDEKKESPVLKIKKDRFYHYLIPFLEFTVSAPGQPVDILKLVFGKNYELEKSLIIQDRLSAFLAGKIDSFNYESDFEGGSQAYSDLFELFYILYPDDPETEFSKFDKKLLHCDSAKSLFIEIKQLVTQITSKYE